MSSSESERVRPRLQDLVTGGVDHVLCDVAQCLDDDIGRSELRRSGREGAGGHGDHAHPGSERSPKAVGRIFDGRASVGANSELVGYGKVDVGERLPRPTSSVDITTLKLA